MVKKNIFVIGDLVIDHTIFVKIPESPHQPVGGEKIFEVLRRVNTAGGAANVARTLSILNEGKTFLWGIVGHSRWGDFRTILEESQTLDGARSNIEFRGVADETNAQMNTISRVITVSWNPPDYYSGRHHEFRFYEYHRMHIPNEKRRTVLNFLERADEKYRLDAIIINDLDMGCLTAAIIEEVSSFATAREIPIFVDPTKF